MNERNLEPVKPHQITEWYKNPVTRAILYGLEFLKDKNIEELQRGVNLKDPSYDRLVAQRVGRIEQIDVLLHRSRVEAVLDLHKLIYEESDNGN